MLTRACAAHITTHTWSSHAHASFALPFCLVVACTREFSYSTALSSHARAIRRRSNPTPDSRMQQLHVPAAEGRVRARSAAAFPWALPHLSSSPAWRARHAMRASAMDARHTADPARGKRMGFDMRTLQKTSSCRKS